MPVDSTLRCFLASAMLMTAAAAPATAQEARGSQLSQETGEEQATSRLFFDSVNVDLVNVEVVVTDKRGQPVTGLTRDDFEIFEDGRKVDLTNFHEFWAAAEEAADEAPAVADEAPEVAAPADRPSRHLVILVDNMNISPQSRKLLFTQLREYLRDTAASAAPHQARQVMLATLDRKVEVVLPFTADHEQLLTALKEVEHQGSSHSLLDGDRRMFITRLQQARLRTYTPPRGSVFGTVVEARNDPDFDDAVRMALDLGRTVRTLGEQRYRKVRSTVETLGRFCAALGGMPDRKALIYLSDGLPMRPADSLTEIWIAKYQNWALQNSSDIRSHSAYPDADRTFQQVINSVVSSEFDLRHELDRLTTNASSQRVAFYPISTYGRSPEYLSASASTEGSMLGQSETLESFTRDASLLQMAKDTGGVALIRSANFGELLDRVDRDFATYYALGYRPPRAAEDAEEEVGDEQTAKKTKRQAAKADKKQDDKKQDNKFRKVEVRVKREGVVVRHGRGYNPRDWRERLGAMTLASALFDIESNPLGVELELGEATREGNRFRVPILLKVPFDQIRLVYQGDQYIAQLTAVVVIRNEGDGGLSEPRRIDFPIKISGRRILEATQQLAGYVLELEIDQGPKRIAVGLRDHFARTESTVNLGIMVGEGAS